jgi:prophage antirepressor-like protein
MTKLPIVRSSFFDNVACDFYRHKQDIWMTRRQIGEALEYADPQKAIDKIHERRKDRLNQFSVTVKLTGTDGKVYDTILYSTKGIYEICRWSNQPKANDFFDWVYDVLEQIRKNGRYDIRNHPDTILRRKLSLTKEIAKGLPKPKQIELRRLAVIEAAEESGADYSAVLAVLAAPETSNSEPPFDIDKATDVFLQAVRKTAHHTLGGKHVHLAPNEDIRICQELNLPRGLIFKCLEERGLIQVSYDYRGGIRKKHYTAKSPYYGRRRCVQLSLQCFDVNS